MDGVPRETIERTLAGLREAELQTSVELQRIIGARMVLTKLLEEGDAPCTSNDTP